MDALTPTLTLSDVRAAAARIHGRILRTPTVPAPILSRMTGADITLKLDNLQAVGSFKERGAANRLALLTPEERARGVVAMSRATTPKAWPDTPPCTGSPRPS